MRTKFGTKFGAKFGAKLGAKFGAKFGAKLRAKLGAKLRAKLGAKFGAKLRTDPEANNYESNNHIIYLLDRLCCIFFGIFILFIRNGERTL